MVRIKQQIQTPYFRFSKFNKVTIWFTMKYIKVAKSKPFDCCEKARRRKEN